MTVTVLATASSLASTLTRARSFPATGIVRRNAADPCADTVAT